MNLGERSSHNNRPETMAIEEEMSIKPQQSRPKRKLLFMWNRDELKGGQNFALLTLSAGCMENEAEQMPLVLVYTQPQNAKQPGGWWRRSGSGVQYLTIGM